MQPTKEAWEKWDKFLPWLNKSTDPDKSLSWAEAGLKDGAPEEAKVAYADYLEMKKRRDERGLK
jgi:hypothetical protein